MFVFFHKFLFQEIRTILSKSLDILTLQFIPNCLVRKIFQILQIRYLYTYNTYKKYIVDLTIQ